MDRIYECDPVDRTAGTVTGQSGCEDELTVTQERENIVAYLTKLERLASETTREDPKRKRIVIEIEKSRRRIRRLNKRLRRYAEKKKGVTLEKIFLTVALERLPKEQINRLMIEAKKRLENV